MKNLEKIAVNSILARIFDGSEVNTSNLLQLKNEFTDAKTRYTKEIGTVSDLIRNIFGEILEELSPEGIVNIEKIVTETLGFPFKLK